MNILNVTPKSSIDGVSVDALVPYSPCGSLADVCDRWQQWAARCYGKLSKCLSEQHLEVALSYLQESDCLTKAQVSALCSGLALHPHGILLSRFVDMLAAKIAQSNLVLSEREVLGLCSGVLSLDKFQPETRLLVNQLGILRSRATGGLNADEFNQNLLWRALFGFSR